MKSLKGYLIIVLLPALATAGFVCFAYTLLAANEQGLADAQFSREVSDVAESIGTAVRSSAARLDGLAAFWQVTPEVTPDLFQKYLDARYSTDESAVHPVSLQWEDETNVVRYAYPLDAAGRKILGFDDNPFPNRLRPLLQAKATGRAVVTDPIMLEQGYPGIIIYRPLSKDGAYAGSAVGVFSLHDLLAPTLAHFDGRDVEAWIRVDDRIVSMDGSAIYTLDGKRVIDPAGDAVADPNAPKIGPGAVVAPLTIADKTMDFVAVRRSPLGAGKVSSAFLGFGVVFVLAVALFVFMLERGRTRLRDLAARERDFVSLVSHQLRLPLTQLSWSLDTVFGDAGLPDEKRKAVAEMRQILRSSVKLVTDLLNVSRIDRGVLKMDSEEVPVAPLIDEALVALRDAAGLKEVSFAVDVPENLHVYVDRAKAVEAVRNVVENAVKYGPRGGRVSVSASLEGQYVRIVIADQGSGIDKATGARVFEKSSAYAKKGDGEGAGIGLYLTKVFVERMRGSVGFTTTKRGTTFTIALPAHAEG